jgi:hypothetical protein
MRNLTTIAAATAFSLTLGTAAVAYAHPGAMGGKAGAAGAQTGPHTGMQHGMRGAHGPAGMQHGPQGPAAAQQLMTPEERAATKERMRAATTPEERQQIATATRAEMQKRAADKGITLPEQHGPRLGTGAQTTPGTSGHTY